MYREWDRCGFWQFVALQHCSRCCFVFVCGNVVSGGRKKDDAAANAVYQSGAGRTAGRFDCVSGTAFVPVGGDIFLYAAAWSCMDTHTDRMDYRRVPASEKQEKEQKKRGKNPKQSGHRWRRKNSIDGERQKRNMAGKRILPQKRRIQQKTKYLSGIIVRFPMILLSRHTGWSVILRRRFYC